MVADRDSSSRYCSESESEGEGEYGDETKREDCIARNSCACRSVQLHECECEPRLKVVRSTVVAERLVTALIEYRPRPRPRSALSLCLENGDAVEMRYDERKSVTLPEHSSCNREIVEAANTDIGVAPFSRSNVKISRKYSLDRTDMSLIYSLTPSMDAAEDRERGVEMQRKGSQWSETGRDWREEESANDLLVSWTPLLTYDEAWNGSGAETANGNGQSDSEYWEVDWNDEGSDTLEVPTDTIFRLLETSGGEAFRNDISDSANQIIAELNGSDNRVVACSLVNEIFQRVCDTLFSVRFNDQASSLPCSPLLQKEETCKNRESQSTPSVLVIREIIHHVIDTRDSREQTSSDVWTRSVRESLSSLKEEKAVEAEWQMDKDEDEEDIPCRNFIETGEESGKRGSRVTATTAAAAASADTDTAVLVEFRTIARKKNKERDVDEKAFELNFRVETNDDEAMKKNGMHGGESVELGVHRIYPANRCAVDLGGEGCSLLPIDEEKIDQSVSSLNDESSPVAHNYRDRDWAYVYDREFSNGGFESRLNDGASFLFDSQHSPLASRQSV